MDQKVLNLAIDDTIWQNIPEHSAVRNNNFVSAGINNSNIVSAVLLPGELTNEQLRNSLYGIGKEMW